MKTIFKGTLFITVILATLSAVASNVYGITDPDQSWDFKVLLDDSPIGYHRVDIDREQNSKTVHTRANFHVRFLLIPVYSYEHETRERWEDGCLVDITSTTDDNGDDFYIRSEQRDGELALETQDGSSTLEGCVRTFAYWDIELLRSQRLLNTQNGEYLPVDVSDLGTKTVSNGDDVLDAHHYRLVAGDRVIDLWYTSEMRWLALESVTESGRVLRYLPEHFESFSPENPS